MRATVAAEILGLGWQRWRPFVKNPAACLRRMLVLVNETASQPVPMRNYVPSALSHLGGAEPKMLLSLLAEVRFRHHFRL